MEGPEVPRRGDEDRPERHARGGPERPRRARPLGRRPARRRGPRQDGAERGVPRCPRRPDPGDLRGPPVHGEPLRRPGSPREGARVREGGPHGPGPRRPLRRPPPDVRGGGVPQRRGRRGPRGVRPPRELPELRRPGHAVPRAAPLRPPVPSRSRGHPVREGDLTELRPLVRGRPLTRPGSASSRTRSPPGTRRVYSDPSEGGFARLARIPSTTWT